MSTKSDLLGWINASLGLQLQRLEQELDIGRLSRGAPAESLELMQWLAKHLKRQGVAHGYDAAARRALSVR
ncbi:hypothetical protein HaLaN_23152, partial [Haematococcus lacustris]